MVLMVFGMLVIEFIQLVMPYKCPHQNGRVCNVTHQIGKLRGDHRLDKSCRGDAHQVNVVTTPYVVWRLVFTTFVEVHTGVIFRGRPRDDSKQFARKTL